MTDHFYLTLPSDSSAVYYPSNSVAHYVTKLPERIRFEDGDYEVGLSEIVYPHTWYNVDNRNEIYWIGMLDVITSRLERIYIKSGYYRNGDEFASSLTQQATRALIDAKFTYIKLTGRMRMQIHNSDNHLVILSWDLLEYLGFQHKLITEQHADVVAPIAFDANRGLNLVYVYCDVASHVIVGDVKSPLLRVCNVAGRHEETVRNTYERPHYVPIGRRDFDTIEIAINNERGEPMSFIFGKAIVTLHFRRIR